MDSGKLLSFVILLAVQNFQLTSGAGASWGYFGNIGPSHWGGTCLSQSQSPIDIQTGSAMYDTSLADFVYTGYDSAPTAFTLKNNGHTAQIDIDGTSVQISGGSLSSTYTAAQWHFHWGSNDNQGSEHTMNANKYPMEMHIVHYKNSYGSLGASLANSDGLAVLGYFVEVGDTTHPGMQKIVDVLSNVVVSGSNYTGMTSFPLNEIVSVDPTNYYYRYSGSLTTPTCNEVVTWTVFDNTIKITAAQLAAFRTLQTDETNPATNDHQLSDNYRPVQSLNGRTVSSNNYINSGAKPSTSIAVMFVAVIMCFTRNLF